MDPNLQTGRTKLWRMNFPDGKQYVVRADSIENAQIGTTSLANAFWGEITQRGKMERNEWMAWTDLQSRLQRRKRSKK